MSLRKGSKVWVEDRDLAWVAAEVVDFVGKQVQVVTASGKKVDCFVLWNLNSNLTCLLVEQLFEYKFKFLPLSFWFNILKCPISFTF